ncbi:MAG: glycosyltransferase, partial [Geobacteraceae bacterium]|nr:glycosyltransferase [Geobacteraceae bacterium]
LRNPEICFVYTAVQHFGNREDVWCGGPFDPQRFLRENQLACTALFRRRMFDEVGGLKLSMAGGFEDWEFWISGYEKGWQGYLLNKPYFLYRKHTSDSMLGSIYKDRTKVDYLKAKIITLHPKLYTDSEKTWAQTILAQPNPLCEKSLGVETLRSRTEIRQAREEMSRRNINCLDPAVRLEFQRKGWMETIGDVVKSWDVLKTIDLIERNLTKDSPILDIGAYCSEVPCVLARMGYKAVSGIDLNPDLAKMPYNDLVCYHIGNFMESHFEECSFSAITAISVIEHGFDSRKLLTEVSRLLKPGGYFIASVDYWPEKVTTDGLQCFGLDWQIFSKQEILSFMNEAKQYGLLPVGESDLDAQDRTVDWNGRQYTFAWLALKKEDSPRIETSAAASSAISSVVIAHTEFPFSPTGVNSGAEMATIHVARNLAAFGIKVQVLGILKENVGTIHGVEYRNFTSYNELCDALSSYDEPADVIIANSVQALENSARNSRFKKRVLWVHAPADSFRPQIETINRYADAVIHVSRHQMALAEKVGFTTASILLYNGFCETVFYPAKYFNPFQIIYAGALVPLKGVHLLIEAFPKIKSVFPEATLIICGSSSMWGEKPYLDQEHISNTNPDIKFLGAIPQNELARLFSSSALGVIPTIGRLWQDPFPLTPVEMQACGLPVLVSEAGGLPESVTHATGFVLNSESPEDWADTIISILSDQNRLRTMRQSCINHAKDKFRWESLTSGLLLNIRNLACRSEMPFPTKGKKRQNVIAFLSTFNQPCGIATHTEYIIKALKERLNQRGEAETRILILAENSNDLTSPDPPEVVRCWNRNQPSLHRLLPLLLSHGVSTVHIQFQDGLFSGTDLPQFVSLCKNHDIRIFLTLHSSEHSLHFTSDVINRADRVFTHLDQSVVRYCAFGADPKKIRVIPHGIHENPVTSLSREEARRALNLPLDLRIISSFGFFDPYKGVHEIIQQLPEVFRHHNAAFIFVGGAHPTKPESAEYIRYCRSLAEELRISPKVLFAEGFLDEEVVSRYLAASDVIVMNYSYTRNEISGAAAFALAHRRPLITSSVPAFSHMTTCTLQLSQGMTISQAINLALGSPALSAHLLRETDGYIRKNNYNVLAELLLDEYGIHQENCTAQTARKLQLKITWQGPQFIWHSMAHVNRELCLQLLDSGHDLTLTLTEDSGEAAAVARFAPLVQRVSARLPGNADFHVRHWYPPDFSEPQSGRLVMIQPWEFGSVPKGWIDEMNRKVDEVWVPSSYVRDCYLRSGMAPDRIAVVPNGIDTDLFSPAAKPLPLATQKRFRFLYVGSTTLERKGFDILINAFVKEFTDADDVCLVVKDMAIYTGGNNPLIQGIEALRNNPGTPEIHCITDDLTPEDLAGLYTACTCLVHPYRGEGFCLPIAEAMASSLPVIVTGHGACLDFCNDGNAYLIPARESLLPEKRVYGMETVDYPWWAEPDPESLRRLMRRVMDNPAEAAEKARAARATIVEGFTWKHAARAAERCLQALSEKPIRRLCADGTQGRHIVAGNAESTGTKPGDACRNRGKNILVISPTLPTFDRDSGSFRLFQIIRILRREGHAVTFIAMGAAGSFDAAPYIQALKDLGVTVYPLDPERLAERIGKKIDAPPLDLAGILKETPFDYAYIYFYHTAAQYLQPIRSLSPATHIVVDSVDFHFIRQKRNAELYHDAKLLEQAYQTRNQELQVYGLADSVIAVTEEDKRLLLEEKPDLSVHVIPNIHPVESVIPPCEGREGVLFIGNFFHDPNIDAVMYLCRDIWPLVRLRLPDARLYIVGNSPPEQIKNLAGNGIVVTGYVPDTGVYLRNCKVSVSPLRYGAGMKGKVGEALAAGIPVVATSVASEGTGLVDRVHLHISDDPVAFAAAIIHLHENTTYWNHLSKNGHEFIRATYSPEAVGAAVNRLFQSLAETEHDSTARFVLK